MLVSADPATAQQFSHALQQLSISTDLCREIASAIPLLNRRKFDAVIVDLQPGEEAGKILDAVRISPSNRTAVTFAISGGAAETAAWRRRSAFVFERPLSEWSIRSTLRPAYGLILRERRRYFRCPFTLPVVVFQRDLPQVHCRTINISEGGMALSTHVPLKPGEEVQVQFTVPGRKIPILAESKVCWWKTGHIGIRFVALSEESKSELQDWLSQKLEELLPEFVAEKFDKPKEPRNGPVGHWVGTQGPTH